MVPVEENIEDIETQAESLPLEESEAEPEGVGEQSIEVDSTKLTTYDPLRRYLLEISRFLALSKEEEHRLAVEYHKTGDREAAYRLVTSNLKLVVKIAMIYQKVYQNLLDLIQEGNIGLIQAVKRFDPYRGTRLTTYATWWIKAYILKFLLDNARMVKVGTTNARRKILMHLGREKRELEARGIIPTSKMLAENLGVSEAEILDVEQAMTGPDISLDAPAGGSESESPYVDTLNLMVQSVDDKIAQGEFREMLERKFKDFSTTLSDRERVILQERLIADAPQTLQQIADKYSISREAVRVAEKKLVAKIKKYMIESFGDVREIEFNLGN